MEQCFLVSRFGKPSKLSVNCHQLICLLQQSACWLEMIAEIADTELSGCVTLSAAMQTNFGKQSMVMGQLGRGAQFGHSFSSQLMQALHHSLPYMTDWKCILEPHPWKLPPKEADTRL